MKISVTEPDGCWGRSAEPGHQLHECTQPLILETLESTQSCILLEKEHMLSCMLEWTYLVSYHDMIPGGWHWCSDSLDFNDTFSNASCVILEQAAQGSAEVTVSGSVQEMCRCSTEGHD